MSPASLKKRPPTQPAKHTLRGKKLIDEIGQIRFAYQRATYAEPEFVSIPISKFELVLDCCGSFLLHFSIDKNTEVGREGRILLMHVLEPLLGREITYGSLSNAVQCYWTSNRFIEGWVELTDNAKRFLDEMRRQHSRKFTTLGGNSKEQRH